MLKRLITTTDFGVRIPKWWGKDWMRVEVLEDGRAIPVASTINQDPMEGGGLKEGLLPNLLPEEKRQMMAIIVTRHDIHLF